MTKPKAKAKAQDQDIAADNAADTGTDNSTMAEPLSGAETVIRAIAEELRAVAQNPTIDPDQLRDMADQLEALLPTAGE